MLYDHHNINYIMIFIASKEEPLQIIESKRHDRERDTSSERENEEE